jgi:glycosyltransferase involved in cell wall biosynthesis
LSVRPLVVDLGRDYRGGQHQALLLLKGLLSRGHAPELVTISDSRLAQRARAAGVSVHAVDGRRLEATWRIRQLVRNQRVDLVHANEPHALTCAWAVGAHHLVPLVAARRIALPLSSSRLAQARYRAAARIVAVSDFVRQSVVSSGLPASRVQVIYDGVEIPRSRSEAERRTAREQLAIPPEAIGLLNSAAFVPEKGHLLLLQAFARIREQFPTCVLLLAGEGPEKSRLQELVRSQGIGDSVHFLGFVPEPERVFPAADLFVFPSHEEPLGSALLLAMAHGLPVVAVARGGIPEVVEDGKNGLIIKELDAGELAAAIARLLSNQDEAARLGRAARETILGKFSADHMVNATIQLYQQLVAERRRSTAENRAEP